MTEMELFDKIENYLKNRLSLEARQAFENEMAVDSGLSEAVALHRDMLEATVPTDVLDLRRLMEKSYRAEFGRHIKKDSTGWSFRLGRPMRIAAAASIILAVAAGVWWMQRKPSVDIVKTLPPTGIDTFKSPVIVDKQAPVDTQPILPTKNEPKSATPNSKYASLVQEIYQESPFSSGTLMGAGNEPERSQLQKASEAYAQNRFSDVVTILQTLPEKGGMDARKLRAHSLFQLGRHDRAAGDFEELTKSFSYGSDAEWYLLLCYAARLPKTKPGYETLLKKVSAPGHPFQEKALYLKDKIPEK